MKSVTLAIMFQVTIMPLRNSRRGRITPGKLKLFCVFGSRSNASMRASVATKSAVMTD
ncbi:hypothetical protein LF1_21000 [Rubripirellula obstinata]|uniref:Uncharacterized protein n=1 Tax=Rubripirellula obstinata TaxID=406547 RepID=A0A5B1CG86_9BACT|nr:hypothetical protein LF1_21000 [Rubripirellula obstinata]